MTAVRWVRRHRDLLIVLTVIFALQGALFWNGARTRAEQQHQAQVFEQKLCTTLSGIAALKPPPGNPVANPSRAFDQRLHARLAQLAPDVGCP